MKFSAGARKMIEAEAPGVARGFFIAIEGLDGAGKTTQCALLGRALEERGLKPLQAKEPTGGSWGEKIRRIAAHGRAGLSPAEELDYFLRDRAEDVERNIAPALLAGRPVICDRYILSNIAYQSALGLDEAAIRRANRPFPWPDLTVILEAPAAAGLDRIAENRAGGADSGFEELGYLSLVKAAFDRQNGPDIVRLDALRRPEEIAGEIISILTARDLLFDSPLEIIDTHCHLSLDDFAEDFDETVRRAAAAGVVDMLDVGLNAAHARLVVARAGINPRLHAVVGWHPHEAADLDERGLEELAELARRPEVVAFGEIGLDYCLMRSPKEKQLWAFERLLELAAGLDLPIAVHSRDAFDDTLALLRKFAGRLPRGGVIHCFNRGWDEAEQYLDLGFHLSLPGTVTFPNSQELRQVAALAPADRLLTETDAPFLAPAPKRGRRNEPSYLVWHLKAIAAARGLSLAEAARLTTANARRLFRLPSDCPAD
ncbi:MAG: dTMP kinase [Candidatus Adiutrix sp.]|jgi:TatD DNase family protein|nr:dTMP kinase [Candidatus Adiutrix sp.]